MEVFLIMNGYETPATVDEQEQFILSVASGQVSRAELTSWIENHLVKDDEQMEEPAFISHLQAGNKDL
jgi:prophage maintenance system killer protein